MKSVLPIHVFAHHAMATHFQVRIVGEERDSAAQVAMMLFSQVDILEGFLSRFSEMSEISQIAQLLPGETLRLSEPVFTCLQLAQEMERVTRGAFSVTAAARRTETTPPQWTLSPDSRLLHCVQGPIRMDLGAIGKGFALDRMAEELSEWGYSSYLLNAGGSSILAGEAPPGSPGWDCGLGEDQSGCRYWLSQGSLSGSGVAVKGRHILDPRTGQPAEQRNRVWVFAPTAAVSDALSTACMVLSTAEIGEVMHGQPDWLALIKEEGSWRSYGNRLQLPVV